MKNAIIILLCLTLSAPSFATGKKHKPKQPDEPPTPTITISNDDNSSDIGPLIVAGIATWLIIRHRRKHHKPPRYEVAKPPIETPRDIEPVPPDLSLELERDRRMLEAVKKQ